MKTHKVWLGAGGVIAVLAVCVVGLSPLASVAQSDPFIGTWRLNVTKSTYSPGPPPRSNTLTVEAAGQGIRVTAKGTDAEGKPTATQYTASYDGKDYPVTGNPDWDAVAFKRVDAYTLEFTRKKAEKVVQTGTNVGSKDGKTRTVTSKGINARGEKISNVAVYEKQ